MTKWMMMAAAAALTGCIVDTPFRGPGYDPNTGVTVQSVDTFIVAVTNAQLRDDWRLRSRFWDHVEKVEETLNGRPGFVGFSKRTELFGDQAWTMTVWTDEASLDAFVASAVHQTAIEQAMPSLTAARFARLEVGRSELPVSWDRALGQLKANARDYD